MILPTPYYEAPGGEKTLFIRVRGVSSERFGKGSRARQGEARWYSEHGMRIVATGIF